MLEPEQLLEEVIASFQPKLAGKRIMITAGPTFEPIDPVRGITNLSSGKMGYAVAARARSRRRGGAGVRPGDLAGAVRRAAHQRAKRSRCTTR
jgi:phosphopantothenoylcysteine synthetase/decarboxylase